MALNYTANNSVGVSGLFGYKFLRKPADLELMANSCIMEANKIVDLISQKNKLSLLVSRVDRISDILCTVLDASELIRNVHPDFEWQKAADEAYSILHNYLNHLNTNQSLYNALLELVKSNTPLSEQERRVAELLLKDFEKSGIHFASRDRMHFIQINDELQQLSQIFGQHSFSDKEFVTFQKHELNGLPFSLFDKLTRPDGLIEIPTHSDYAVMVQKHSRSESTRKKMYMAMNSANEQQIEILETLLKKRGQLAALLGKRSFAEMHLADKMASSPKIVDKFLHDLALENRPLADYEVSQLTNFKQMYTGDSSKVEAWDRPFYQQFVNQQGSTSTVKFDSLSNYFTVGSTFKGISDLFKALYGIYLEPETTSLGEVWCEDVRKIAVIHETEGRIGTIYCDLFERQNGRKYENPAHFTIKCSRKVNDDEKELSILENQQPLQKRNGARYQLPIVVLVTNFARPQGNREPSLTLNEIDTLFHEMGHAMHSMLAQTDFQHISGTRVVMDFVEVPSIFMEYLASVPQVLAFGRHYETGKPVPLDLLREERALANRSAAFENQHQIMMAMLDQKYHSEEVLEDGFSSTATMAKLQNLILPIPHVHGTFWQVQFSHLSSYGCSYYSYLWSRKWANRLFKQHFEKKRISEWRKGGDLLRNQLLAVGGGRDPWIGLQNLQIASPDEIPS